MATPLEEEQAGAAGAEAAPEATAPPSGEAAAAEGAAAAQEGEGKQLILAAPKEEEPVKPVQQLCSGDRVVIEGMVEKEKLNGASGILVAMTGDRWQVRLDGKGRWLLKTAHLVKVDKPSVDLRKCAVSIVGTFDNWKGVHDMSWDADCNCYHYEIKLGSDKEESFQFLLDKNWQRRMHPDKNDANPYSAYNLLGPDNLGHEKNWTIGKHACDKAEEGARYRVSLSLLDDGNPKKINWTKLSDEPSVVPAAPAAVSAASPAAGDAASKAVGAAATAPGGYPEAAAAARAPLPRYNKVCIVGEFNEWQPSSVPMKWDEARRRYSHKIKLGYAKQESFQICVDGEWTKCIHPDESDGCFRMGSIVCGPDDDGHDKNWTIGIHPHDRPARGAEYEVRLSLNDDGTPNVVDWTRLDKAGNYDPDPPAPPPVKLPPHEKMTVIAGWNDWKPQQMKWDADRRCYHLAIEIGPERQESFQFWLDGDSQKCLHPSCMDGGPFTENRICGPDAKGHNKNWTIGQFFLERADQGVRFEVRLWLTEDGSARLVDWDRIRPGVVGRAAR